MERQLTLLTKSSDISDSAMDSSIKNVIKTKWTMFIDGASRGNPGPSGAGVYLKQNDDIINLSMYLGRKTNNQAEYLALVLGLYVIQSKQAATSAILITSDSELLVKQMQGYYKIKNPFIKSLNPVIKSMLQDIPTTFKHVLRVYNKEADALANIAIDRRKSAPDGFVDFLASHNIKL